MIEKTRKEVIGHEENESRSMEKFRDQRLKRILELYEELFKEMEFQASNDLLFVVPKWKKDILLLLLKKAKEPCTSNNKAHRKEIRKKIETIQKKAFEEIWRGG